MRTTNKPLHYSGGIADYYAVRAVTLNFKVSK
jgi:hypothetical protein